MSTKEYQEEVPSHCPYFLSPNPSKVPVSLIGFTPLTLKENAVEAQAWAITGPGKWEEEKRINCYLFSNPIYILSLSGVHVSDYIGCGGEEDKKRKLFWREAAISGKRLRAGFLTNGKWSTYKFCKATVFQWKRTISFTLMWNHKEKRI